MLIATDMSVIVQPKSTGRLVFGIGLTSSGRLLALCSCGEELHVDARVGSGSKYISYVCNNSKCGYRFRLKNTLYSDFNYTFIRTSIMTTAGNKYLVEWVRYWTGYKNQDTEVDVNVEWDSPHF